MAGRPGVGKTTLVRRALSQYAGRAAGFYTQEVREGGRRIGFDLSTLAGEAGVLARVGMSSPYRVGRYGVDMEALEGVGVVALCKAIEGGYLMVVDEIGKMELFSLRFRRAIEKALEGGVKVLGTIMLAPHPWADRLKRDPRVQVITLTPFNRQEVLTAVVRWLDG